MQPQLASFFDPGTATISHVVYDQPGGHAAIIDPVLDYDAKSGRIAHGSAGRVLDFIRQQHLSLQWILETHAHADHLSAAAWLQQQAGGRMAIGEGITQVQQLFKGVFNLGEDFTCDGSQFDHLFADGEVFHIGQLTARAVFVPGHTPADMAYQIGDMVFVGDTLFMPDVGSARCDFPGGDAAMLYQSVQKLLTLPDDTRLLMCHDYPPQPRPIAWQSTVAEQKQHNIHLHAGISQSEFVALRQARDATLDMPQLILPAIQVNIRAGQLPAAENNGVRYLKIPLDML
ncbi:MBL fold metallo-hydrolase [Aquitalea magnusonii]|uniref:MBL fold metallo-hydrolase n=2 Tax=Aquitalea TaxID=407217 RepID=A0A454JI99_9NEIS|nr:MBL fold metallo-hydrolase [Aquitalea palustris]MBA4707414.1 MBL fold metallo-hydrolase [Aquitalea magnusonii]RMC97219.1 MBL fold metallo-hydrolase [Aquitalea palustris]